MPIKMKRMVKTLRVGTWCECTMPTHLQPEVLFLVLRSDKEADWMALKAGAMRRHSSTHVKGVLGGKKLL